MSLRFFKNSDCPSCGRVSEEGARCPWCGERVPWQRRSVAVCARRVCVAAAALIFADALSAMSGGCGWARALLRCFAPFVFAWALLSSARLPPVPAPSAGGRFLQMLRNAAPAAALCAIILFCADWLLSRRFV